MCLISITERINTRTSIKSEQTLTFNLHLNLNILSFVYFDDPLQSCQRRSRGNPSMEKTDDGIFLQQKPEHVSLASWMINAVLMSCDFGKKVAS